MSVKVVFLAEYMEMDLLLSAFCSFFGVGGGGISLVGTLYTVEC